MKILQMIYPIIISHGGGNITPEQLKTIIGVFILLNIIWLITLITCLISLIWNKNNYYDNYIDIRYDNYLYTMIDVFMGLIWMIIIMLYIGNLIGRYI